MKNSKENVNPSLNSPSLEEDEPVRLPILNNSALINRFRLTLVGRIFHFGGRSTEAFLAFMPSNGIWDLAGRVRGFDLGNGRFHFNFETEEDLQKVLKKRPYHFNKWTFSLERWELNFQEDLLNRVTFWIKIRGLPLRCWVDEAFRGIGETLGQVMEVDVNDARVLVSVDVTKPLKFVKKVVLNNGDEISVSLTYEKLFRYGFTCSMISHEERDCPHLSEDQRILNKERRVAEAAIGDRRPASNYQKNTRRGTELRDADSSRDAANGRVRHPSTRSESGSVRDQASRLLQQVAPPPRQQVRRHLQYPSEKSRRDEHRSSIWRRIENGIPHDISHPRENSTQSSSGSRKRRIEATNRKEAENLRPYRREDAENHYSAFRRREPPLRIRSPTRDDPSLENWRNSRCPSRHQAVPNQSDTNLLDKGKGKMIEPMDDNWSDDDRNVTDDIPPNFEFGSGSRTIAPLPNGDEVLTTRRKSYPRQAYDEPMNLAPIVDTNQNQDDGGEVNQACDDEQPIPDPTSPISDWEKLADPGPDQDLTEEQIKFMKDFEKEMILDGLLEEDDLLGEDLEAELQNEAMNPTEESLERRVTDPFAPINYQLDVAPVTSQSPTSKRMESPAKGRGKGTKKANGPKKDFLGPSQNVGLVDQTAKIPKSPKVTMAVSRKMKAYQKTSPKHRGVPPRAAVKSKGTSQDNVVPHPEEVKDPKKKKASRTKKPSDGPEESRNSPEPPA